MLNVYLPSNRFIESNLTWPTISSGELAASLLLIFFSVLFTLEFYFPHNKWPSIKWRQSWQTNISLFLFNNTLLSLMSVTSLLILAEQHSGSGVLGQLSNPMGKLILSFLLLDLFIYFWHRLCHSFDGLWQFHKVHHSDPYMNVSTTFRVHILELIIVTLLKAVAIVMFGIDKVSLLFTEIITTLFVMIHHSNISFAGERLLGCLFISPFQHRGHHSKERSEHDMNYGAVFSIWDRFFGTLMEKEPAEIGIKNNGPLGFLDQLKFGFGFTHNLAPTPLLSHCSVNTNLFEMIAEAAYYKAQNCSFSSTADLDNWLEAEREINDQFYNLM